MWKQAISIGLILVAAAIASAGALSAPFGLDSTGTLPKGIRSVRITSLTTAIDDKFNNDGTRKPLGNGFNKDITFSRLTSALNTTERGSIEATIESQGHSLDETAGTTNGMVNTRVTALVPVAAYGVTNTLTAAVAVPVFYSYLNVSTGWTASANTSQVLAQMVADGAGADIRARESMLQNVVRTEFEKKGYKSPHDQEKTQMGDMSLVLKNKIAAHPKYAAAVQGRVVVPTGHRADVNDLSDFGAGDGQWDVGAALISDYYIGSRVTLTSTISYLNQLPARVASRIPTAPDETLTPDIDHNTAMDLGDALGESVAAKYKLSELFTFGLAGAYQYKTKDHYSGGMYESTRYDYLERDTEQNMFSGTASIGLSTIELFKRQAFLLPLDASLAITQVFSGRNVNANTISAFELVSYF